MPLDVGTRLGPYEILAAAGAGGMGEVYKARDTRLNRTVAIKILPPFWAHDPAMRQRFEREAKTIAALNHPNVCTLHDVGHEDATETTPAIDFLVMEYLEGETLAERINRGEVPLAEALKIALAIADALDRAHKQGVVHRDLKPSNVILTKRGPKLLDFGLAKASGALEEVHDAGGGSMLPTAASVTTPGTILGTVQYMAPEQLEGKEADARTDIFAFGVVFYEMLTGRKAFQGKSKTLLMSAILTSEPKPLGHVQPMTPASLDHLVRRCLAKDPEERWQTLHDLLIQLRWIAGRGGFAGGAAALTPRQRILRGVRAAAVVLAGALAFPAAMYLWKADAEPLQFRSPVVGISPQDIAVSPDGRTIAFVATAPSPRSLYVRPVRSIVSRRIAGTEEAAQPFWSPDSRSIGFVAKGELKRVEAEGGAPKDVAAASDFSGGAWSQEGTIVFGTSKGLMRVSAEGGTPQPATTLEKAETGHLWPAFLPDGRHFLYLAWTAQPGGRAVFSGALESKERAKVMDAESNVAYAAPGYLLFHREASVFAQPFDAGSRKPSGQALHLADGVLFDGASGRGAFAVSQAGALIYFQGADATEGGAGRAGTLPSIQLGWVSRGSGTVTVAGDAGAYGDFDLSPDGRLIAVTRQDAGASGADIWVVESERGVSTPITRDPADDVDPVWSHDSRRIAYTTYRKGNADIYVRNANGTGPETPLVETPAEEVVRGWSSDGRYLLYVSGIVTESDDIYALPLTPDGKPDGKPLRVVTGPGEKAEPQLSYDGKWLAYVTNESGTPQVMVTSFPDGNERIPISKDGGGQPRWRRDGKELYYRLPSDNTVMAVPITPGARLTPGLPQTLFRPVVNAPATRNPFRHQLAVNDDGTRFLVFVPPQSAPGTGGAETLPGFVVYLQGPRLGITASQLGRGRGGGQRARGAGVPFASYNGLTVELNWTGKVGGRR